MRNAEELTAAIETTFTDIQHTRMEGVPVVNETLSVRLLGLRSWEGYWLGTLLTPWFMNLVLVPETADEASVIAGTKQTFRFPAGAFEFIRGSEETIGGFWMCSLFSPVFEFTDQETAEACALAALDEIFEDADAPNETEAGMAAVWRGDLSEAAAVLDATELSAEDMLSDIADTPEIERSSGDDPITKGGLSRRGLLTGNLSGEVRHEP